MLVLSRQEKQRIRFPGLGVTVEILDIRKSKVRVGIDAPIEVRVLRDELEDYGEKSVDPSSQPPASPVIRLPAEVRHELRNTLHELGLMFHIYRKRAEKAGPASVRDEAGLQQIFETIVERLSSLSGHSALTGDGVVDAEPEKKADPVGKALVVDDNDNERELMAGFLRLCGYEVLVAADGVEAIRLLSETDSLRVVLLDMNMPGGNGQEFLKRARQVELPKQVNIFVVSGCSEAELGLSHDAGYTDWLQKPLDPRVVINKLNKLACA